MEFLIDSAQFSLRLRPAAVASSSIRTTRVSIVLSGRGEPRVYAPGPINVDRSILSAARERRFRAEFRASSTLRPSSNNRTSAVMADFNFLPAILSATLALSSAQLIIL